MGYTRRGCGRRAVRRGTVSYGKEAEATFSHSEYKPGLFRDGLINTLQQPDGPAPVQLFPSFLP